jgi:hypothetical protein
MRNLGPLALAACLAACAGTQHPKEGQPLEEPLGLEANAGESLLARSHGVEGDLTDARSALSGGDATRAQEYLDRASSGLTEMRRGLPGASLLRDLDDIGARLAPGEREKIDFLPLAHRVEAEALFLDPDVVRAIGDAEKQLEGGQRAEAFASLARARNRLAQDIGAPLVDTASHHLAEAEDALKKGNLVHAGELLVPIGPALEQVRLRAPLVPVRFDLRAAAASAELGDWERARRFVQRAATRLEALQGVTPGPEVPSLLEETRRMERALREPPHPRTADLRWLAAVTRLDANG